MPSTASLGTRPNEATREIGGGAAPESQNQTSNEAGKVYVTWDGHTSVLLLDLYPETSNGDGGSLCRLRELSRGKWDVAKIVLHTPYKLLHTLERWTRATASNDLQKRTRSVAATVQSTVIMSKLNVYPHKVFFVAQLNPTLCLILKS